MDAEAERERCHDQIWSSEGAKKKLIVMKVVSKSAGLKQRLRTLSLP